MLFTGVAGLWRLAERLHLRGAARGQLTAQTDETLGQNKFALQRAHGIYIAVVHGISVPAGGPAVAVGVKEDDNGGEIIIMVDDVLEVGQGLATLILGGVRGRVGVVHGVNEIAPSGEVDSVSA